MKNILTIAILLPALLSTACQSVYKPKAPIPNSVFSAPYLADLSSPTLVKDYDAIPEGAAKMARRNQILWEVIWLTDQSYEKYEASFFSGQAYMGTAGDALSIALSSVSAVTGTAHLKAVLAAISGGAVGIESSYQKNFFDQATRESIVQIMRASRLTVLSEIESGMTDCTSIVGCSLPGGTYSLEQGLLDTTDYYDAGTITGALVAISNSTSQQSTAARLALRELRAKGAGR